MTPANVVELDKLSETVCTVSYYDYRFVPVWNMKTKLQFSLSLLCTLRVWPFKWLDSVKLLLHGEYLYGFSPVWTLMCLSNVYISRLTKCLVTHVTFA